MKVLSVFDIDDTLIKTSAFIHEVENGERVRSHSTEEWRHVQDQDNLVIDWSEVQCSHTFRKTAEPIHNMIRHYKNIYDNLKFGDQIIMITGRQEMTCDTTYRNTFYDLDIPISRVQIFTAGRYMQSTALNKVVELLSYLQQNHFDKIQIFDDDSKNLDAFLNLDYYDITTYLVTGDSFAIYK